MIARRTVTLTFAIQGNPGLASANRARRHAFVGGRSRSYQSRESKEWRVIADTAIAEALVDARDRICPITPINVEIHSVWPRWSRRYNQPLGDVDNVAKQVLDAIVRAGIIDDDVLVRSLSLTKGYQPHMPRLEITITQTRNMPRNTLTAKDLGITAEDLATAGRVALAIHHHTSAHLDKLGVTKKADACRHAIADTLLHVSGWRTQPEILASWRAWLYQRRKLTPLEAHEKRLEMCVSSDRSTSSKYTLQQTYTLLRHLAEEGSIRYVPRSKTDAGLIVWIGDAP